MNQRENVAGTSEGLSCLFNISILLEEKKEGSSKKGSRIKEEVRCGSAIAFEGEIGINR